MPQIPLARWWLPGIVALAGLSGVTTIWVAAAILSNRSLGWFALVAAADMVFMLQLSRAPTGMARGVAAMVGTSLAILLSYWMIAATQLGFVFGIGPVTSALRLGPVLAWELNRLDMRMSDWIFVALSLPLALWWGRGRKAE